jgi:hypothetical protein
VGRRYDRVCARVSVRVQMKLPVSRRNRQLGRQLQGIPKKKNLKKTRIYIHRHRSMHVGMYVYGILIKGSKQITNICIHIHRSMYVCMYDRMRSKSDTCVSVNACVYEERE